MLEIATSTTNTTMAAVTNTGVVLELFLLEFSAGTGLDSEGVAAVINTVVIFELFSLEFSGGNGLDEGAVPGASSRIISRGWVTTWTF